MRFIVSSLLVLATPAAMACNVTLPSGSSRASIVTALAAHNVVCLADGTYSLGSVELNVPANKTLRGTSMAGTQLTASGTRGISVSSGALAHNFSLTQTVPGTGIGVITYGTTNATIWGLDIKSFGINIAAVNSTNTEILSSFVSNNGDLTNGGADPNIWISNSPDTLVYYGFVEGRGNRPFGDGEISCYDSPNLHLQGVPSFNSGTSAVYLVNCDNAVIENMSIFNAGGFGLDIVGGSDHVIVRNNRIESAWYAGSVFDNSLNIGGSFTGNTFVSNNQSGDARFCNGIELFAASPVPATSSNTVTPLPLICP